MLVAVDALKGNYTGSSGDIADVSQRVVVGCLLAVVGCRLFARTVSA